MADRAATEKSFHFLVSTLITDITAICLPSGSVESQEVRQRFYKELGRSGLKSPSPVRVGQSNR